MLPKIDSVEWTQLWSMETKVNALNNAIQSIQECLDGQIGEILENEIKEVRNAGKDGKKTESGSGKKGSKR